MTSGRLRAGTDYNATEMGTSLKWVGNPRLSAWSYWISLAALSNQIAVFPDESIIARVIFVIGSAAHWLQRS